MIVVKDKTLEKRKCINCESDLLVSFKDTIQKQVAVSGPYLGSVRIEHMLFFKCPCCNYYNKY